MHCTMVSPKHLLLSFIYLLTVQLCRGSQGPVFINPALSEVRPASIEATTGSFVTQTVYGFLDFTTTIGNTVMVFSPQSSAIAAVSPPEPSQKEEKKTVIETKPSIVAQKETLSVIKPTKANEKVEKKASEPSKKVSSVVVVQSNAPAPISSRVEIKSSPSSRVDVIQGLSSAVSVAQAITSKVEVVTSSQSKQQDIISKVEVVGPSSKVNLISSHVEVLAAPTTNIITPSPARPLVSTVVEVKSDDEPAVIIGNNIGEPEYDFLSRQPSEVVEETYKVINLKPSSKFHLKPRPSAEAKNKAPSKRGNSLHPTGLVTKLGGTVVKDGTTTVHETSVIGTYISGKYAQVLQSNSHVLGAHQKGKINPSPTLRILKTAAPQIGKSNKHHRHLEPTPVPTPSGEETHSADSPTSHRNTRKPGASSFKSGFKNRPRKQDAAEEHEPEPHNNHKKSRTRSSSRTANDPPVASTVGYGAGKRSGYRKQKQHQQRSVTTAPPEGNSFTRRGFKPKVQAATVDTAPTASTSLYKFKLNRSPGRWQYKTTAKPRVTIRKQDEQLDVSNTTPNSTLSSISSGSNDFVTPQARVDDGDTLIGSESVASIIDDESSTENKLDTPFPLETLKVEISTPPDFKDIYYEIATVKSPYTFQAGNMKNTRYITITTTIEKSLESKTEATIAPTASEPLTENILATSSNYAKDNNFLDSSIATLPPLYLATDMETPPLETLTETFSTTQDMLKTHILPIVRGANETSTYTLVQTYHITRLVSATKTLPPMDAYQFIPSKTLNEFNSHLDEAGSELHLELEFGDDNDEDGGTRQRRIFPDLDLANIGSDFDLADVDKSKMEAHLRSKKAHLVTTPKPPEPAPTPSLSPEQLQQLALLRLLNPAAAAQGQVITTSKPVIKIETVYESHVIPVTNGGVTVLSTISRPVGTATKTDYEIGTSVLPALPIPPIPQQVNPLFPQQHQFALTSSPFVHNTVVTETRSKILKLTFGAKTAYTTIFSTTLVPTALTTYLTTSVPVQPTPAFPGFFPAPYPAYPFVG